MSRPPRYRRYHVPRGEGEVLCDPPPSEFAQLIAAARERRTAHATLDIGGRSLGELCRSSRQSFVAAALDFTTSYCDVSPELRARCRHTSDVPLLVTGHQAELFHPGVWFKNFVLDRSAKELGGIGVHLVIDTDDCRSPSIRVPTGSVEAPLVESVAFDAGSLPQPYELRRVVDAGLFRSFPDRVARTLGTLTDKALLSTFWNEVTARLDAGQSRIGSAIAEGRHRFEANWGLNTLEIPQSVVCVLPEVRWLMAHLLCELPRFIDAYNGALSHYRNAHKVRSPAQPMPQLEVVNGWYETPFWVYSTAQPERRALYARYISDGVELSDRADWHRVGPTGCDALANWLTTLEAGGVLIRTRALTTTLVARLLLGDLFLHGIGGAKYDEVTTDFATEFFGVEPASYAAISATVQLPIEHEAATMRDISAIDQRLREMRYHPENYVAREGELYASCLKLKRQSIDHPKTKRNAKELHASIDAANLALSNQLKPRVEELKYQRAEFEQRERATRILDSREYAFCLYPEDYLRERMIELLSKLA